MISRNYIVKTHLILASLLMPFLLLMPLSGVFYLLDIKGETVNEFSFVVSEPIPFEAEAKIQFFREQFKKNNIDFEFESIKDAGKELIFRPTTKLYYTAILIPENDIRVYKSKPNLVKKLIELHKGHGPKILRILEIIFGISLITIALSGVWIAVITKPYRKPMLISFSIGAIVILFALF